MTPIEILDALERKEKVNRWIVLRNANELIEIMRDYGYSKDTQHEVYYLIDQAQESL